MSAVPEQTRRVMSERHGRPSARGQLADVDDALEACYLALAMYRVGAQSMFETLCAFRVLLEDTLAPLGLCLQDFPRADQQWRARPTLRGRR